jgi:hypothetical protein
MLALPPAHVPPPAVAGVRLSWPSATTLLPGAKVTVRVRSRRRRAVLSLVRVDGRGTPTRAIARRTLRDGTFAATLPSEWGATYALRATIARTRYWSWISTPPPGGSIAPPAEPCPSDSAPVARLSLGAGTVARGAAMPYKVINVGKACLTEGAPYLLDHLQDDGTWATLPPPPFPMYAVLVPPGTSYAKHAAKPADAPAGT